MQGVSPKISRLPFLIKKRCRNFKLEVLEAEVLYKKAGGIIYD
jgi:hypothetical protein